jgi:hypothetical protein
MNKREKNAYINNGVIHKASLFHFFSMVHVQQLCKFIMQQDISYMVKKWKQIIKEYTLS